MTTDVKRRPDELVNIYQNQADKDSGTPLKRAKLKTASIRGFLCYKYKGELYPAFLDTEHYDVDGCLILERKIL